MIAAVFSPRSSSMNEMPLMAGNVSKPRAKNQRFRRGALVARAGKSQGRDSFVLRVRGDGRRYKFTMHTESGFDAPIYQCAFTTKRAEREEHGLAFKDFVPTFRGRVLTEVPPLNSAKIASVGFLISDQ